MVQLKTENELSDEALYPAGIVRESTHIDEAYPHLFPPGVGPGNESTGDGDEPTVDPGEHLLPPLLDS